MEKKLMELIATVNWNIVAKLVEWSWVEEHVIAYTVQSGYRAVKEVQGVSQSECFREI